MDVLARCFEGEWARDEGAGVPGHRYRFHVGIARVWWLGVVPRTALRVRVWCDEWLVCQSDENLWGHPERWQGTINEGRSHQTSLEMSLPPALWSTTTLVVKAFGSFAVLREAEGEVIRWWVARV